MARLPHRPSRETLTSRHSVRMTVPDSAIVARLRAAGCVFAEDEARLLMSAARNPAELDAMVSQRAAGLPLEQVVGWAEFCGLRIAVAPGVFVPRRRTEFLVLGEDAAGCAEPGNDERIRDSHRERLS